MERISEPSIKRAPVPGPGPVADPGELGRDARLDSAESLRPRSARASEMTQRVVSPFNPANAVTASRFLTLPPFVWAVDNGYHQWATLIILLCGLLDKLDGLVAKVFDCRSPFGEMFDAITDGICYGFCLILVAAYGWAPVIPVASIIFLGVANSGLRAIYTKRAGRTVNYKSYAMERIVA
ncbi:MAG: CDP-alcohol phosphatidyltransferase family protein, partial [Kofleriaceae bacterium]